jgi:hypothetical protein
MFYIINLCFVALIVPSFYKVTASLSNTRNSKGYRYSIYKCGEECHALYHPAGKSASIYYEDDGTDLQVRLMFRTLERAEEFQTKLNSFASEHPHFAEKLTITRAIPCISVAEEVERVLRTDYKSSDNNDSPEMSLNDVLSDSASVVSLRGDTSRTLQALEDSGVVGQLGSLWYKCHLIPAGAVDPLKNDPDNFIYASWPFHQHLDGLHTPNGIGLAISLDPTAPTQEEVVINDGYELRWRVVVLIHFQNIKVANVFQAILKPGTERLTDTCFKSFIHVRDDAKFSKCIKEKLQDQKQKSPWVANLGIV